LVFAKLQRPRLIKKEHTHNNNNNNNNNNFYSTNYLSATKQQTTLRNKSQTTPTRSFLIIMLDTTLLSSLWQHSVTFVHHKLCLGSIFGAMVGTWLLFMMIALLLLLVLVLDYLVFQWPGRTVSNQTLRPVRASAFTPDKIPTEPIDTIVIGSGSGGCSCANLLAQSGQTVLLLEQHQDRTGGCTHTFRLENCEWDTGMHYVSKSLGDKTQRPGALLNFMTKNLQGFTHLTDPYDQVLFPTEARDAESAQGKCFVPNGNDKYDFVTGAEPTVDSILKQLCPNGNDFLKRQMLEWMELCRIINDGFTALGLSRILPKWLQFLVRKRVERLYQYASYTVRDVQYAMFNEGYSKEDLLEKGCPKVCSHMLFLKPRTLCATHSLNAHPYTIQNTLW